jgi:hypothetical protein
MNTAAHLAAVTADHHGSHTATDVAIFLVAAVINVGITRAIPNSALSGGSPAAPANLLACLLMLIVTVAAIALVAGTGGL